MNTDALTALLVSAMFTGRKNRKVSINPPTPEQIARQEKEKERAAWNAAVEAKKTAKENK